MTNRKTLFSIKFKLKSFSKSFKLKLKSITVKGYSIKMNVVYKKLEFVDIVENGIHTMTYIKFKFSIKIHQNSFMS